jgi:short-subunit dehydrogenase involved in D-alanine esterification of teichoic acids
MEKLKLADGRVVVVQGDRATVHDLKAVQKELTAATARLAEIPDQVTDEELLVWARENYPRVNYGAERQSLEAKVAECKLLLEKI